MTEMEGRQLRRGLEAVAADLEQMRQQLAAVRGLADTVGAPVALRLELCRLAWRADAMAEVVEVEP